jgi:hypothetical protein
VIATEPFFSVLSRPIFKYLHHEPVDFGISEPQLAEVQGPLASANIALPWLIFFQRREWLQRLNENFNIATFPTCPFSALSYLATGAISRKLAIPHFLCRAYFQLTSPSVAAFLASAQLFYGNSDTTLRPTDAERRSYLTVLLRFLIPLSAA